MYRGNNTGQGCLLVKAYSLSKLRIKAFSIEKGIKYKVSGNSLLFLNTSRLGEDFKVRCNQSSSLKINCGLVCTLNQLKVLKVNPNLIFLSKSNNFADDVYIVSNVVWNIN